MLFKTVTVALLHRLGSAPVSRTVEEDGGRRLSIFPVVVEQVPAPRKERRIPAYKGRVVHGAVRPGEAEAGLLLGEGHYYGVPYGVVGVLLAGFLGWFLGKSMQETGGFVWAWLIHFLQDVIIFTFLLM